jgi:hypothetical protein
MPVTRTPDIRDQEVLRANRELSAYFRGLRTEREARAALKIIKAFIRDRQRTPVDKRRLLPGTKAAAPPAISKPKKKAARRRPRRVTERTAVTAVTGTQTEEQRNGES